MFTRILRGRVAMKTKRQASSARPPRGTLPLRVESLENRTLPSARVIGAIGFGGSRAGVIAANPVTNRVFAAMEDVPALTAIEETSRLAPPCNQIPTRGFHTGIAVNPATNLIYVSGQFAGTFRVIDGATCQVLRETAVPDLAHTVGALAVDPVTNRLYVIRSNNNDVAVFTTSRSGDTFVGSVRFGPPSGPGCPIPCDSSGIAVNPATNRIYVANMETSRVTVINGATLTVVATPSVGVRPIDIDVNPVTHRIYVANINGNTVSVLDGIPGSPTENQVIATVIPPLGCGPLGARVNPDTNRVYVTCHSGRSLAVLDGNTNSIRQVLPLAGPGNPAHLALLPDMSRIYIEHGNGVTIVEDTHPAIATLPVDASPGGVAVNPATSSLYVSNSSLNTVSVFDAVTHAEIANFPVGTTPRVMAVNAAINRIYVVNTGSSPPSLSVIDGNLNRVIATIPVPGRDLSGTSIAICPNNRIFVTSFDPGGRVVVFDGNTNTVLTQIDVPANPISAAYDASRNRVYIGHGSFFGYRNLTYIDCSTLIASPGPEVGLSARAIAVNPAINRIYVRKGDPARGEPFGVVVLNSQTMARVATVPLANDGNGIAVNPTTHRVYTTNGVANDVSILDGTPGSRTENRIVATASVGRTSQYLGVNPLSNRIYVTNIESWTVSVLLDQAAATHFNLSAPAGTVAGTSFSLTVTARNALFNTTATKYRGTVRFTSTDGAATLPPNYTFTAGDNGAKSFPVTLRTVGSRTLTVTDTATGSTGSVTLTVNPATAKALEVSGFSSPTTAGGAGTFLVTARDTFGNVATGYSGTVRFTSTDPQALLPANATFTAADNGTRIFAAALRTVGSRSLTATDTANPALNGTQVNITVNPAAASRFVINGFPGSIVAGTPFPFTVCARDDFSNTASGYRGTVRFTSTDPQATLPNNYTFTAGDNGCRAFPFPGFRTAGPQTLTVTDISNPALTGSATTRVLPAAASRLEVSGFPSPTTAGGAGTFLVTARDPFGNVATGYTGTVRFTSTDSQAFLPANATFIAADNGTRIFAAALRTVGSRSLTATDTVTATITGTQANITVNPAAASRFLITGFPASIVAGTPFPFTVCARDDFGNTATGYRGTVRFTSTDSQVILPGNYTFTAADNACRTFPPISFRTAGPQTLTVTDISNPALTGSATTRVLPAAASRLEVSGFPSPTTAGGAGTFLVTARDAFGNVATGYIGTVRFTSTDSQASLPNNYTFVAADSGTRTFAAVLRTAGMRSLTATDTVTASITGTQVNITVNPAAASRFVINGFPASIIAGTPFPSPITVCARDDFGNTATGYRGTVRFTSTDPQVSPPANYIFMPADNGCRSFPFPGFRTAGPQTLTVTDITNPAITGSATTQVVAATASRLEVSGFPSPTTAGDVGGFVVTARDLYGNTATSYRGLVRFTSSDPLAKLPKISGFSARDQGVRAFGAILRTAGLQSITATDTASGITGTQNNIQVDPAAPAFFYVDAVELTVLPDQPTTIGVYVLDEFWNLVPSYAGQVTITSTDPEATLPADYTFDPLSDGGIHYFWGEVILRTLGTQYITVTDVGTGTLVGTAEINVVPGGAPGGPSGSGFDRALLDALFTLGERKQQRGVHWTGA